MVEGKQKGRLSRDEIFTERWMMEHYGYNFRTTMQEGASFCIMKAYNLINGKYCSASLKLLDTILRQKWGFPFYVVSDWIAVRNAKNAILSGTDLCMGSNHYKDDLPGLVSSGQVPMAVLDKAVANILRTKILTGMMDYRPKANGSMANSPDHVKVALDASRKSIVLLKNVNQILPLNKSSVTKIALIGPNANAMNLDGAGSAQVKPPYSVSVKKGIETKIGVSKVVYSMGCGINSNDTSGFKAARLAASQADYVIFVGGLDATQEGEANDHDRVSGKVELPGMQQNLINALASVNKKIIVVIHSGGVCGVNSCVNNIKGLVYSFYPGQEAGNAVADVLFGDYSPGGKMPVTMPKNTSQLPVWDDDFTNDYGCGYRWFDEKSLIPEFAFGYGLSYTTFEYSNLKLSSTSAPVGSPIRVSVDVKNTGALLGDEVVQLYVTNNSTTLWMPKKELKGFKRLTLNPGEKQTVNFTLDAEEFYFWNEKTKRYEVGANNYVVKVGGSSDALPLSNNLTLTPSPGKPDLKITQVLSMPRYPIKGQRVSFCALVKNQGNFPVTPNNKFKVSFKIDNVEVAVADNVSLNIQPGQAVLIESTNFWIAPYGGQFIVNAVIDKNNSIDEWEEDNNEYIKILDVIGDQNTSNHPPLANAGPDISVYLPNSSAVLDGSFSKDADGDPITYDWKQISGPTTMTLSGTNTQKLTISNITVPGVYTFKLIVSDNKDLCGDIVTVTVENDITMSIENINEHDILIYPNPTSDHLFINVENNKFSKISLCDLMGRVLIHNNINKQADLIELTTSGISRGLYLLILEGEERTIVKKVEIQ